MGVPVDIDGLKIHLEGYGSKGPSFKARDWYIRAISRRRPTRWWPFAAREGATVTVKKRGPELKAHGAPGRAETDGRPRESGSEERRR